jgi:cation diffusion facilitator family transporter
MFTSRSASLVNIFSNVILFTLKFFVGIAFSNLSLISEAFNSLIDVLAAIGITVAIWVNDKDPDKNHHFGHSRAESIAGYTVGVLMFILGFQLVVSAILRYLQGDFTQFSELLYLPVAATLVIKVLLYIYIKIILRDNHSPALKANLQDHRNDIVIALGVLLSIFLVGEGYPEADNIISIFIGLYILRTSYDICRESVDQLMGKSADDHLEEKIRDSVISLEPVKKIKNLRTQQLGSKIGVDITVSINISTSFKDSHNIYHLIQDRIYQFSEIQDCTVHLEPYRN